MIGQGEYSKARGPHPWRNPDSLLCSSRISQRDLPLDGDFQFGSAVTAGKYTDNIGLTMS